MTINRTYMILGGVFGFLGVAIGAFGAHSLKPYLTAEMLEVFRTGVMYQLIHTVVICALALAGEKFITSLLFFAIGIVLFSFTLYIYALSGITWVAMVTPLGGVSFLIGWAFVIIAAIKK